MKRSFRKMVRILVRNRQRRAWQKVMCGLSCVVVFCTVYALILPAITLTGTAGCGKEEHTHGEACYTQVTSTVREEPACVQEPHSHTETCYDENEALICGYADFFIHTHDQRCRDASGALWCALPEIEAHVHDDSCYAIPETEPAHIHTDGCYTMERGELSCQEPVQEGHTHSQEAGCYDAVLHCGLSESAGHSHSQSCYDPDGSLICGVEEGYGSHTHSGSCYEFTEALICGQEASGHQHTDECYLWIRGALNCTVPTDPPVSEETDAPVLVCEKPEAILHEHTEECYGVDEDGNRTEELICTQTVVLAHQHTDECFTSVEEPADTQTLTCAITEGTGAHTHGDACHDEGGELVCGQEESTGHVHGPMCYGTWVLSCELEEHTHSLACDADPAADVETPEAWEQTFASVELTGAWSEDALAIGESQLDYRESEANYTVSEDMKNGYTRYGAWYGEPYSDWNTLFAAFCLHYAGVPQEAFPWDASCRNWVDLLTEKELFAPANGEYRPGRGDLAFLDMNGDGLADRVCLIQTLTTGGETGETLLSFTAVEGDCDGAVAQREYAANDTAVLGYGILSAISDLSAQADTGNSWGYNEDGSIYWESKALAKTSVTAENIAESTPYIIAGRERRHVMTAAPKEGTNLLVGKSPSTDEAYEEYAIWYFEKVDGGYRVYTGTEAKQYLKILDGYGLGVTETVGEASVFTVGPGPMYENCVTIKAGDSYVNANGDDQYEFKGWGSWTDADQGSHLMILPSPDFVQETAHRLDTAVSGNTVINLFDYWTNPEGAAASDSSDPSDFPNQGINKGHNFAFYKNSNLYESHLSSCGTMNRLASQAELRQGIVANRLGEDGYPVFSGDPTVTGGAAESLAYLFNPNTPAEGKESYHNVKGLLRISDEGYYFFDSRETMAEFQKDKNTVAVYDQPGVLKGGSGSSSSEGQFFPMNQAPQVMNLVSTDPIMNHYFGMTITTRFVQRYGGFTDAGFRTPTTFSFSGDDDVWIFIDGVLVADLGGAHASVSVDIDFSNGNVTIHSSDESGASIVTTKTLKELYENAQAANTFNWNGNTFADNSTHTLKFYYLERGNWDSNLYLKYNLTEIPPTHINKVDQYGHKMAGVKFAVYAADSNYNMLSNKGGTVINAPAEPQYADNGDLLGSDGAVLAKALYTGVTNKDGEMVFVDPDGMPYSISELEGLFGNRFILREIEIPDGYRLVIQDVKLFIWHGGNQAILQCANTSQSGSRAATTLQVTATDTLYLQKPYNDSNSVEYCDENGQTTGTLFAVVYKYIGDIDEAGNAVSLDLYNDDSWTPVYGSDEAGYRLVDRSGGKSLIAAALEAARAARRYGEVVFTLSSNSTMQLTMENLPGYIITYYRMLGPEQKGATRYTVAYYWTPADSLDSATADNTYRVYTFAEAVGEGGAYSAFDRVFGANIQVPNLINNVLVQKVDENENRINGATFALYKVRQDTATGVIRYLAEDGSYVSRDDDAVINTDGTFVSGGVTVRPLKTGVTKDQEDGIHTGTTGFSNLDDGQYIIKEVQAPPGYKINTADVMLLVTEDTIYANAGTETDGVSVGRGPGFVVKTLEKYASEGEIDNTLSWIYAQMRISNPSTSFADVGDESKIAGYLTKDKTSNTSTDPNDAARAYLEFATAADGAVFNYVPNEHRSLDTDNPPQNPTGTRRLFTTAGWPYYEIYQDYEYGLDVRYPSATYARWEGNLMHLFSRSTYVRVTDVQETSLQVKKVSGTNKNTVLSGVQFRLYRCTESNVKEYYSEAAGGAVSWVTDESKALTVTTGSDGLSQAFRELSDGIYYLEETKAPASYRLPTDPVRLKIENAIMTMESPNPPGGHEIASETQEDNTFLYTVTVPNYSSHELPATGGMGVTLFYVLGSLLIVGAGLLLIRKRTLIP